MAKYRFWPERPPGPVDEAYVQTRWVRPYRPGPLRVLSCLLLATALVYLTMVALLATLTSAGVLELAVRAVIAAAVFALLVAVFARCFLAGVWVTEQGVRSLRPFSTRVWAWTEGADVRSVAGETRLLASPLRVSGRCVVRVLAGGSDTEAPVTVRCTEVV